MDTGIQNIKIELIQWLTVLDDKEIIRKILELKERDSKDWWDEISEEEKESIKKGIADAENRKVKSHTQVRTIYEKWL